MGREWIELKGSSIECVIGLLINRILEPHSIIYTFYTILYLYFIILVVSASRDIDILTI